MKKRGNLDSRIGIYWKKYLRKLFVYTIKSLLLLNF